MQLKSSSRDPFCSLNSGLRKISPRHTDRLYAETAVSRRSEVWTSGVQGGRCQLLSTADDDESHLLMTLSVQCCVQRDGRLGVTASHCSSSHYSTQLDGRVESRRAVLIESATVCECLAAR